MTSHQIRQAFLDFFKSKQHLIVASAPLVAKNDPTLMFNNSGMAQFKDFFLGNGTPPSKRVADTQKCLRVSGKHNDLEDVGFDTYHHTMFEMLGNWSFGDYFKKEALAWSWELLTEVLKLPKERIYVSVFGGDAADNVPFDQEAWDIWKGILGGEERIILGNKKDNFWEMGDVGPCGPCSEIHIDLRDEAEIALKPGKDEVNNDHPQVVEIWNNVFMQFERKADKSLVPLPATHVDTGMGFERLCMAIQGKKSNYDTDIFQNTIQVIEKLSGKKYGLNGTLTSDSYVDVAMRVISDHLRAVAFTIADGQLPSNAKAGYVIRRILRRAVRYGFSYLDLKEPFMCQLVPVLAEQFKDVFPELQAQVDFVSKVVEEEEKSFLRTLEIGLKRLDQIFVQMNSANETEMKGDVVFELSDTFGFPSDLTALIAKEKGLTIDEEGFKTALAEQKKRSRADSSKEATDWVEVTQQEEDFEFLGYDQLEADVTLLKYRKVKTKTGEEYHLVTDKSPFYAEMGGQVGDSGIFKFSDFTIQIKDTKKENDLFVHISTDKNCEKLGESNKLTAKVDAGRRQAIMVNHTATHLMLSAMRQVLGTHIVQKGSYQNESVTRFDFSHFSKVTDEELSKIEAIVNQKIIENIALEYKVNIPIDEAIKLGATATFGEKYGDFVRVVIFDPQFSVELCGGTHITSTGQIGLFKFTSEGSVSAGVRRVEAITGVAAYDYVNQVIETQSKLQELLKNADLIKSVENLQAERSLLLKKVEALELEKIQQKADLYLSKFENVNGINCLISSVQVNSADALKTLAFQLKSKVENAFIVFAANIQGKPSIAVLVDETLIQSKNLHAGNIIRELAKNIKGGGGGQPSFAQAGGSDVSGLDQVLIDAKKLMS